MRATLLAISLQSPALSLPFQIISEIFGFLKPWDRRNAALVCKMWKEATYCRSLYNRAVFRSQEAFERARLLWSKDTYHPFSVVEFENINEFPNDFDEIWSDIGKTVTALEFVDSEGLSKSL